MYIHPACHVDRVLLEAHWLLLASVRLFFHTWLLPPPQFTLVVSISLNSPPFKFDFACIDAACNYIFTPSEVRQMPNCDFAILEVFHHVIQKGKKNEDMLCNCIFTSSLLPWLNHLYHQYKAVLLCVHYWLKAVMEIITVSLLASWHWKS